MKIHARDVLAKTILTQANGYLDVGYTHSLNPYGGCAFACRYCYVREMPMQKFKTIPWGEWLDIKTNAAQRYRDEVERLRRKHAPIHIFMSSATDPYQPMERTANVTRAILEQMLESPPDSLQLQTRGPLVRRDIDLFVKLQEKCKVVVSMTIETDREEIRRIFAPYAPGIKLRLRALQEVHEAGISTQASVSPVLPFTPDFPKRLHGIVDRIWIDTLSIGDGSVGKRSARLGMPQLFAEHGFSEWYRDDLHQVVRKHFENYFSRDQIRVSKDEAFFR